MSGDEKKPTVPDPIDEILAEFKHAAERRDLPEDVRIRRLREVMNRKLRALYN